MRINEVAGAIPLRMYKDRNLFTTFPSEKNFYYFEGSGISADLLNIKYVFICTDNSGVITRLTLFIDNSDNTAENILNGLFDSAELRGESFIGDTNTGLRMSWMTEAGAAVFMFTSFGTRSVANFPVTEIHLEYPNACENFGDYSIDFKFGDP